MSCCRYSVSRARKSGFRISEGETWAGEAEETTKSNAARIAIRIRKRNGSNLMGLLLDIVLRTWPDGRRIRWLGDGTHKCNQCLHVFLGERFAPSRHHGGFSHGAAAKGNGVLQQLVTHGIQHHAVICQSGGGIHIRAIGGPGRGGVGMAPDAIGIKQALPLRLRIVQRNDALRIVPVDFDVVRARDGIRSGLLCATAGHDRQGCKKKQEPGSARQGVPPALALLETIGWRRVSRYAVIAFNSLSFMERRGSMVCGSSAWGSRSQASIHSGRSQRPALLRLGPT